MCKMSNLNFIEWLREELRKDNFRPQAIKDEIIRIAIEEENGNRMQDDGKQAT